MALTKEQIEELEQDWKEELKQEAIRDAQDTNLEIFKVSYLDDLKTEFVKNLNNFVTHSDIVEAFEDEFNNYCKDEFQNYTDEKRLKYCGR